MRYKQYFLQEISGQRTTGGKKVKGGLLYRSGDLYRLRPRDLARLSELGIKQSIDLRETETAADRPYSYSIPQVTNMPVRMGEFARVSVLSVLRREVDWSAYDFDNMYARILEENKDYLGRFLDILVDGPHPVLIHCTAGKDRTGVFVSVLLLALLVPREIIMEWYLSPASHLKQNTPLWAKILGRFSGLPWKAIYLNAQAMENFFNHLDQKYQGIEGYLSDIGFNRLSELRSLFTE